MVDCIGRGLVTAFFAIVATVLFAYCIVPEVYWANSGTKMRLGNFDKFEGKVISLWEEATYNSSETPVNTTKFTVGEKRDEYRDGATASCIIGAAFGALTFIMSLCHCKRWAVCNALFAVVFGAGAIAFWVTYMTKTLAKISDTNDNLYAEDWQYSAGFFFVSVATASALVSFVFSCFIKKEEDYEHLA